MPEIQLLNDWSAGWCPADDPINGRKNGLLQMDGLELDQNGALRLTGGSSLLFTYAADAHTIYSKFLKDGQYRYVNLTNGDIYRNSTLIDSGGSTTRAGFGAAFDYVIVCSGAKRIKDDGTTATDLGVDQPLAAPAVATGAAGNLTGDYTYIQVNVVSNGGAYKGRSTPSAVSTIVSPAGEAVDVDPEDPVGACTEIWIYRKGGDLDQYYRVYVQDASLGSSFTDDKSDFDVLNDGIILDVTALSINDIADDIVAVVGPVNGRLLYFTYHDINFSQPNSPDSYVPGQSIDYAGTTAAAAAEMFLWAIKVSETSVMVGTTRDMYILTGTFITAPDGTLDVYLRSLGVENPSISIDVDIYNGNVACMTAAGWKLTDPAGNQVNLCDNRVDRLYRGESLQDYGGVPILVIPQYRYSCCVVRDKLYVRVPQIVGGNPATTFTYRMEVYDFKRKYWRPLSGWNPLMLWGQEDDAVLGFFGTSHTLRSIDDQFTKLNNGNSQSFVLKTPIFNLGMPRRRKDLYYLSLKANSFSGTVNVYVYTNSGTQLDSATSFSNGGLTEVPIPLLSQTTTPKDWQLLLTGSTTDLLISDISFTYDLRPEPTSAAIIIPNLGPAKKRIRTWPFKIDPMSASIDCIPYVDGVATTSSTFTGATETHGKEITFFHFFKTDIFGVDYKMMLLGTAPFELYPSGEPEIVQVLPIAKQFDQVGPIELWRYGILRQMEVRAITFGGTTIPYIIYIDDTSVETGNLTYVSGKESSQCFNIPRTKQGTILRVELGPTSFDFHRLYARVQFQKSGSDTENIWKVIDEKAQD